MAHPRENAGDDSSGLAQQILDTALELGEQRGWNGVHLHEIAQEMGIGLAEIGRHYESKDAIADAWFDRADLALLSAAETTGWLESSPRERLHRAIFCWLDVLAGHRRLTSTMLRYKLQPEHLHLQVLGVLRISRTVQWIREVACLTTVGWRRELEEAALTAIYLSSFARWLNDESEGAARTHAYLDRQLAGAERIARRLSQSPLTQASNSTKDHARKPPRSREGGNAGSTRSKTRRTAHGDSWIR